MTDRPPSLAVFGEALIDVIPAGGTRFDGRPGGSPANVAVAAARLGLSTRFVGGLSTDRWGTVLAEHLEAAGVDTSDAPRPDRPTALAVVALADEGTASYRFLWEGTADRAVSLGDLPDELGTTWLQVGSVSGAFPDSGEVAMALVRRERDGVLVSCDPNVRPSVHGADQAVRGRLLGLADAADLVKASDEDLAFLLPDEDPAGAIDRWIRGGAGVAAVTRGGHGAVLGCAAGRIEVAPEPTEVGDTVGAGDTFMAGLVVALTDAGLVTRDALHDVDLDTLAAVGRMAAAAAAVTVSRVGADPPTRGDLPPDVLPR
jgi:fructokinase